MRREFLTAIFVFACFLAVSPAQALIGATGTTFSSDGYITTLSIAYNNTMHVDVVEGGSGGGIYLNSVLTIKVYDNTTTLPYVEIYDNDDLISSFTMTEKEVAKINVTSTDNQTDTYILITDMRGNKAAWINLVDYTCTGTEDIRKFWVYNSGWGFPDALIFTWLGDCEQLVIPLYVQEFPL